MYALAAQEHGQLPAEEESSCFALLPYKHGAIHSLDGVGQDILDLKSSGVE